MKRTMRLMTVIILLLTVSVLSHAQDDIDYEQQGKATTWFADRADGILIRFEGLRHDSSQLPQKCSVIPYSKAGSLGFALVVSTWDERQIILFTPKGNDVSGKVVNRNDLPNDIYWGSISELGVHATKSSDITLSERPLPVRSVDKDRNHYKVVINHEKGIDPGEYKQMIFKPHKNAVRLESSHNQVERDEQGAIAKNELQYVFKLKDPAVTNKMFRGYNNDEALPWIVKNSFFDNHTLLQYNRWKGGEPIKKASAYEKQIISNYYGGRPIKETRWLATLETAERTFYAVQFEHQGTEALAALVCIAEGEVVSTWEFHGTIETSPYDTTQSVWFVDDEGDFMGHAPEIHCMVATDQGLELYVRLFGGESVQYFILREMSSVWMEMQADIWVYVWD